jgi:hypothetical protein
MTSPQAGGNKHNKAGAHSSRRARQPRRANNQTGLKPDVWAKIKEFRIASYSTGQKPDIELRREVKFHLEDPVEKHFVGKIPVKSS